MKTTEIFRPKAEKCINSFLFYWATAGYHNTLTFYVTKHTTCNIVPLSPSPPLIIKPFQDPFILRLPEANQRQHPVLVATSSSSVQCAQQQYDGFRNFSRTTERLPSSQWLLSATFTVTLRTSERKTGAPDPDQWPGEHSLNTSFFSYFTVLVCYVWASLF